MAVRGGKNMKNFNIRKKALFMATTGIVLIGIMNLPKNEHQITYAINEEYTKDNSSIPFATCSNHDVYISTSKALASSSSKEEPNIFIIDQRDKPDPNMCVRESFKITDSDEMKTVIEIMQAYDIYPSEWNRTSESMLNEWKIHNFCCGIDLFPNHTEDVDFNNADESIYNHSVITKMFGD